MEAWAAELQRGRPDAAWDLLLARYRRLIFAAIRHYARDHDDVMDVFAQVCESLREGDQRRLRVYLAQPTHSARFSTWLVTVVRHITVDWFRHRDGRRRLPTAAEKLPPMRRRIFEYVFLHKRSHVEAYELLKSDAGSTMSFGEFLAEVSETYRAVSNGRRAEVFRELGDAPLAAVDQSEPPSEETREALEHALGTLTPQDRVAVELYVLEDLPAEAVARVAGLANAKAVYNRVYRALAVLRERLEQAGVRAGEI